MKQGTCKHYAGDFHNTHCAAGVCYKDVTTEPENRLGIAFRKPCVNWDVTLKRMPLSQSQLEQWAKRGHCDKYQEPSAEEIKAYEAELDAHLNLFKTALPIISRIKKEHKSESWKGVETCPVCKGKLHMTHASINGHVWGQCETKGCLSWME